MDCPDTAPLVTFSAVSKRFGELTAVRNVSLSVGHSEIHALVGENGAGKSTLMNLLYAIHQPDEGEIFLEGRKMALRSPADALAAGIGMVHQHFKLAPSFTVAENIILGAEPGKSFGRLDRAAALRQTRELCERLDMPLDPMAKIADLPVGMQQKVEIVKAMYRKAKVLILDEPTAVLTPQETRELFAHLKVLAASGTAIIFITHKLREVLAISHRISVMRHGEVVSTLPNRDVQPEQLASLMVGRSVLLRVLKDKAKPDIAAAPALRIAGLSVAGDGGIEAVHELDLDVRPGEIVGIAGVQGNGQDELVQAITGFVRPLSGRVSIGGVDVTGEAPAGHRRAGLAYVPADRGRTGLSLASAIWENLAVGHHRIRPLARRFFFSARQARLKAAGLVKTFDVRGAALDRPAGSLSGGNQQKVVLARELSREVRSIVIEQPSQGVDIGAIEAIHQLLVRMRDQGKGILLVSADLDEIMSLSDRIAVMYRGRIVEIVEAEDADVEAIGRLMGGLEPLRAA